MCPRRVRNVSPKLDAIVFAAFEKLVDPYPDAVPPPAPKGLRAFLWANTEGVRRYVLVMTTLTALIGAFEARTSSPAAWPPR